MIQHIEGRMFTKMTPEMQVALIILTCILAIALCLTVADKNIPKEDYLKVYDPAIDTPPIDTPITGHYLIDGQCVPVSVKMFYQFDDKLGKIGWWCIDSEVSQNNMGRPFRWTYGLHVPAMLLWASKKGR